MSTDVFDKITISFNIYFSIHARILVWCLSESFLSEIPKKSSENLLPEVIFLKLFHVKSWEM